MKNGKWQFHLKDVILFRFFASPIRSLKIVVPKKFGHEVLKTGHDSIFVGHLVRARTLARIQSQYFGKELSVIFATMLVQDKSVRRYRKKKDLFVTIQISFLSSRPFKLDAIDIVGKIYPSSARVTFFL